MDKVLAECSVVHFSQARLGSRSLCQEGEEETEDGDMADRKAKRVRGQSGRLE